MKRSLDFSILKIKRRIEPYKKRNPCKIWTATSNKKEAPMNELRLRMYIRLKVGDAKRGMIASRQATTEYTYTIEYQSYNLFVN